jgi:hypothetical protein
VAAPAERAMTISASIAVSTLTEMAFPSELMQSSHWRCADLFLKAWHLSYGRKETGILGISDAKACREMRRPSATVRAPFRHTLERRMSISTAASGERPRAPPARAACVQPTPEGRIVRALRPAHDRLIRRRPQGFFLDEALKASMRTAVLRLDRLGRRAARSWLSASIHEIAACARAFSARGWH